MAASLRAAGWRRSCHPSRRGFQLMSCWHQIWSICEVAVQLIASGLVGQDCLVQEAALRCLLGVWPLLFFHLSACCFRRTTKAIRVKLSKTASSSHDARCSCDVAPCAVCRFFSCKQVLVVADCAELSLGGSRRLIMNGSCRWWICSAPCESCI